MRVRPLLLLLLVGCGPEPGPVPADGNFDILTYNVHGLPSGITGDDTTGRIEQIGPLLNDFDLVGLQESWIDDDFALLAADSEHPTQVRFAEPLNEERVYGSGLGVFAHLPALDQLTVHYDDCFGFLDNASDCLASKGFLAVRLELAEGASFDLYDTHFEAGGGDEDYAVRDALIAQVTDAIATWSADRAVVFVGDFNMHDFSAGTAQWSALLDPTGLRDTCAEVGCTAPDHIDRVLFRDGGGVAWTADSWADLSAEFLDPEGVDLSDHPPIRSGLTWAFEP